MLKNDKSPDENTTEMEKGFTWVTSSAILSPWTSVCGCFSTETALQTREKDTFLLLVVPKLLEFLKLTELPPKRNRFKRGVSVLELQREEEVKGWLIRDAIADEKSCRLPSLKFSALAISFFFDYTFLIFFFFCFLLRLFWIFLMKLSFRRLRSQ